MGFWQNEAKIVNLFRRRASPTYRVGVSAEAEKLDCKNCNMQLGIVQSGFLAERSQIVQLFQWLLKGRDNFRSCQTRNGKQCRWISAGIRIAAEGVVKIMLIVTAVAAAMLLDPRASQAYEGPWCALSEIGGNAMYENCSIQTFELCVQEVIAGNRGFCIPNPRWQAPRRRPGSRTASEGASTTEGTLSHAGA